MHLLTYTWLRAKHYNTQNDSASLSAFFFYGHNVSFFRLPCPPLGCYGDQRLRPLPNNSECEPKRTNSIALLFLSNQIKSVSFSIWHSI